MIQNLNEQDCYDMLSTTTVGRIGFVVDGRVQIFPVNYRASGQELLLRTSADGSLRRLADDEAPAAFEIDFHDDSAGTGWSVLMHGHLRRVTGDESPAAPARITPWAGDDRETPLRFIIESIAGRRVRRERH